MSRFYRDPRDPGALFWLFFLWIKSYINGDDHFASLTYGDQALDTPRQKKKDWTLTPEAFERLLTRLDPDRENAALKYQRLHRALIAYFEHHGCLSPDELADKTFDGVARSLTEGKVIYLEDPAGYVYGVGRRLLRQYHREHANKFVPIDEVSPTALQAIIQSFDRESATDLERRLDCLDKCLGELSEQNRLLVLEYYEGERGATINNRKELALRLAMSINALRVRALRSREELEACLEDCFGKIVAQ